MFYWSKQGIGLACIEGKGNGVSQWNEWQRLCALITSNYSQGHVIPLSREACDPSEYLFSSDSDWIRNSHMIQVKPKRQLDLLWRLVKDFRKINFLFSTPNLNHSKYEKLLLPSCHCQGVQEWSQQRKTARAKRRERERLSLDGTV
jgi:hypothetical protein